MELWRRFTVLPHICSHFKQITFAALQFTISWGWMLNSKSSLPRRISSRRGWSRCSTSRMSSLVWTGCPFSLTITSPSLIPPLKHRGKKVWSLLCCSSVWFTVVVMCNVCIPTTHDWLRNYSFYVEEVFIETESLKLQNSNPCTILSPDI